MMQTARSQARQRAKNTEACYKKCIHIASVFLGEEAAEDPVTATGFGLHQLLHKAHCERRVLFPDLRGFDPDSDVAIALVAAIDSATATMPYKGAWLSSFHRRFHHEVNQFATETRQQNYHRLLVQVHPLFLNGGLADTVLGFAVGINWKDVTVELTLGLLLKYILSVLTPTLSPKTRNKRKRVTEEEKEAAVVVVVPKAPAPGFRRLPPLLFDQQQQEEKAVYLWTNENDRCKYKLLQCVSKFDCNSLLLIRGTNSAGKQVVIGHRYYRDEDLRTLLQQVTETAVWKQCFTDCVIYFHGCSTPALEIAAQLLPSPVLLLRKLEVQALRSPPPTEVPFNDNSMIHYATSNAVGTGSFGCSTVEQMHECAHLLSETRLFTMNVLIRNEVFGEMSLVQSYEPGINEETILENDAPLEEKIHFLQVHKRLPHTHVRLISEPLGSSITCNQCRRQSATESQRRGLLMSRDDDLDWSIAQIICCHTTPALVRELLQVRQEQVEAENEDLFLQLLAWKDVKASLMYYYKGVLVSKGLCTVETTDENCCALWPSLRPEEVVRSERSLKRIVRSWLEVHRPGITGIRKRYNVAFNLVSMALRHESMRFVGGTGGGVTTGILKLPHHRVPGLLSGDITVNAFLPR